MASHRSRLLAATVVCAVVGSPAAGGTAWPIATAMQSGRPGPLNAITDVPGLRVGQVQSTRPPYLTGTTVVYAPSGPVAGVNIRGVAPDSWQTDVLGPSGSAPGVPAIVLTGGSAYGLNVAGGVLRWLEQRGAPIPLAPGAAIHDLGNSAAVSARPTAAWGYQAIDVAVPGPVRQGTAGGGTGAIAGTLKGGVGTASVKLGHELVVGALVVVNTAGSAIDPRDCSLRGAARAVANEFAGLLRPTTAECASHPATVRSAQAQQGSVHPAGEQEIRTSAIAVVATNAGLRHTAAARMAAAAQDGIAQAIASAPTLAQRGGGAVFALATGTGPNLTGDDRDSANLLAHIDRAGADALSRAIAHAMLAATSTATLKSYCDTYPSACRQLHRAQAGQAPEAMDRRAPVGARPRRGRRPGRPAGKRPAAPQTGHCDWYHRAPQRQSVLPAPVLHSSAARWLEKLVEWFADHGELHGHTAWATSRHAGLHTAAATTPKAGGRRANHCHTARPATRHTPGRSTPPSGPVCAQRGCSAASGATGMR